MNSHLIVPDIRGVFMKDNETRFLQQLNLKHNKKSQISHQNNSLADTAHDVLKPTLVPIPYRKTRSSYIALSV